MKIFYNQRFLRVKEKNGETNFEKEKKMKKWFQNGRYLDYILREEAVFNLDIPKDKWKELFHLKNESDKIWDIYKEANKIFDEKELSKVDQKTKNKIYWKYDQQIQKNKINQKHNFSGLYTPQGKTFVKDLDQYYKSFKAIKELEQNVWTSVLSFNQDFLEENHIVHPDDLSIILKNEVEKMLINNGFSKWDLNDLEIGWAFHTNTSNLHAHIFWFEKNPTKYLKLKNGFKKEFRVTGDFHKRTLTNFRMNFENNIEKKFQGEIIKSKTMIRENWKDFKLMIEEFKQDGIEIINSPFSKEVLSDLYYLKKTLNIDFTKDFKYGSKKFSEFKRGKVNELVWKIFTESDFLKDKFDEFKKETQRIAEEKFLQFCLLAKTNEKDSQRNLEKKFIQVDPYNPLLELTEEDYKSFSLQKNKIYFKNYDIDEEIKNNDSQIDMIDYLKAIKINFEQEQFYSFSNEGFPQGIIAEAGRFLFEFMKNTQLRPPKTSKRKIFNSKRPSNKVNLFFLEDYEFFRVNSQEKKNLNSTNRRKIKNLFFEIDKMLRKEIQKAKKQHFLLEKEMEFKKRGIEYENSY